MQKCVASALKTTPAHWNYKYTKNETKNKTYKYHLLSLQRSSEEGNNENFSNWYIWSNSRHPDKAFESKLIHKAQKEDVVLVNEEININEGVWEYLISSRVFYVCTISIEAKMQNRSLRRTQILTAIQISGSRKFTLIYSFLWTWYAQKVSLRASQVY